MVFHVLTMVKMDIMRMNDQMTKLFSYCGNVVFLKMLGRKDLAVKLKLWRDFEYEGNTGF